MRVNIKNTHTPTTTRVGQAPHSGWLSCVYFVIFTRKIGNIVLVPQKNENRKKVVPDAIFYRENYVFLQKKRRFRSNKVQKSPI